MFPKTDNHWWSDSFTFTYPDKEKEVDIKTNDNVSTLTIKVPGIKKESINLKQNDDKLYIDIDQDSSYRSWSYKLNYTENDIKAKLDLGILTITVTGKDNSKKIDIE